MSKRSIKRPDADHTITISPTRGQVVIMVNGHVVADSHHALTLHEADYPPVQYVPRTDVNMSLLQRSDHLSYCMYKGEAAYFGIPIGGARAENAVWSYENPFDAVAQIQDYLAFYPARVDAITVTEPDDR